MVAPSESSVRAAVTFFSGSASFAEMADVYSIIVALFWLDFEGSEGKQKGICFRGCGENPWEGAVKMPCRQLMDRKWRAPRCR